MEAMTYPAQWFLSLSELRVGDEQEAVCWVNRGMGLFNSELSQTE